MPWGRYFAATFCVAVHIVHWGMYIGNIMAIPYLVIYAPWYYTLPLVTILSNPLIGGVHCLYNNLENYYRQKLGWPLIEDNFIQALIPTIQHLLSSKEIT